MNRLDHAYLDGRVVVPIDFDAWLGRLRSRGPNAPATDPIKQEQVGEFFVSTVFLGLDHGYGGQSLWFETMVFGKPREGQRLGDELLQWRYATYDQAEAGHARAVELARLGTFGEEPPS